MTRHPSLLAIFAATGALVTLAAGAGHAHAGIHVSFGGHARGHGGGGWRVGGGIHVGGGVAVAAAPTYAAPPPADCDCAPAVPSYYPVYGAPGYAVAPPPTPEVRRFEIGTLAGAVAQGPKGDVQGRELGLYARLRMTRALWIEGELSAADFTRDQAATVRDQGGRMGAGLVYELSPERRFSLFGVGQLGTGFTEVRDTTTNLATTTSNFSYGELGLGARYAISTRWRLGADVRVGEMQAVHDGEDAAAQPGIAARTSQPSISSDSGERYSRARVTLSILF